MTSPSQPLTAVFQRAAVFAGALGALLALWNGVPVRIACLRGAGAWIVVLFLGVLWQSLLGLSLADDRARREGGDA